MTKRKVRMKKMETRERSPKIALEKVKRRGLYYLPSVSIIVLICLFF